MKKLRKNLKLNWPESLSDLTLKNVTTTEIWFLREMLDAGNTKRTKIGFTIQDPKFGYSECHMDFDDTRYLIKYKEWASQHDDRSREYTNVVFYVQKFKRPII